ncbi:hypothetical protein [Arthrobacter antibioticus]|uniref:hypothetical protein n=1 Tax=Arthrobacter sp. H35-MC1 TaxID=3046203 RepID=UPI0024B8AFAA|nr:hypothetical protein [Arthrobacter sp. H35-MC1]MDJ0318369.1 hypothetical protein [Arthrobacter sp. H35-MC1]
MCTHARYTIICDAWHAALFLTQTWDTPRSTIAWVLLYVVVVIGLSMIMAQARNGSAGTLAVVLAQSSTNGSLGVLVVAFSGSLVETTNWWGLGVILAAAVVAMLTRGRLGEYEVTGALATIARPA